MKQFCSLLLLCLSLVIISCEHKKPVTFGDLLKLEGTWIMEGAENPENNYLVEVWTNVNDTLLTGKSWEVVNGDSSFSESIRLVIRDGQIYYIPSVINQNNGQPVPFKMTGSNNSKFVFENKEHDFPNTIVYELQNDSTLNASIAGSIKGSPRSMEFYFRKK